MNMRWMSLSAAIAALGVAGVAWAQQADEATPPLASAIGFERALEIALAQQPGRVEEVELEREGRRSVIEVEIVAEDGSEVEVTLDAATGEVLEIERESDGWWFDEEEDDDHGRRKG